MAVLDVLYDILYLDGGTFAYEVFYLVIDPAFDGLLAPKDAGEGDHDDEHGPEGKDHGIRKRGRQFEAIVVIKVDRRGFHGLPDGCNLKRFLHFCRVYSPVLSVPRLFLKVSPIG
jgi:hypothetical protein